MTATLEQLVKVRSQLVECVLAYLTQMADKLDQTDWWRGSERLKASEIAVEPFVYTMRKRERPRRSGPDRDGREMEVERRSPMDEIEAERYELPVKVEEREEERWRQVIRRGRVRLSLKGAPGSGKTFTTRQAMVALAREAATQLERQQAGVEEMELPVWVTAKNLAQTGAREIEKALIEAMENGLQLKLVPNLRAWLTQQLNSSRAFIVVDALDELLESDRAPFEVKAKQLEGLQARVIATCRTMHWEERKGWLGWGSLTEVELAPFKRRQQREFTGRFLEYQPDLARKMERLLQVNFALWHACTTPLLLTFACLLHEEGKINESTSYATLYAQMGRLMFSGRWRGVKPDWTSGRVREESCWRFFEDIAWQLFVKAPQLNRFTLDDWRRAAGQATEGSTIAPIDATGFLEELERVGMIVPAGFDEQRADLCWSFAHRTFLEFLAARALSRMKGQSWTLSRMKSSVWLVEAKRHFWFQPEWLEVLTFLAGMVDDATLLIEAVGKDKDDLFGSMLSLRARLVGAARKVDEQVARRVCSEVVSFWRDTLSGWCGYLREFSLPMIAALAMNETSREILVKSMLELTWDANNQISVAAVEALGIIGDNRVIGRMLELAWAYQDFGMRLAAVSAMGAIGDSQAVDGLLELACAYRDSSRRQAALNTVGAINYPQAAERRSEFEYNDYVIENRAVRAMGAISDSRTIEKLLALTRDEANYKRITAINVLGAIGDSRAVERLLELTWDNDLLVRQRAVGALCAIGDSRAVERLLELTEDEVHFFRSGIVEALGRIGDSRAVERLLELTWDNDLLVQQRVVEALGAIGDSRAVERLLELTRNKTNYKRRRAAEALGVSGESRAVERLLEMAGDEDSFVRNGIASALELIGDERAFNKLLELTRDADYGVRETAVGSLGRIGDSRATERALGLTYDVQVFREAVKALGMIGDTKSVDRLLGLIVDDAASTRGIAAEALGGIGDKKAIDKLLKLMRDDMSWVREAAAKALWQIALKNKVKIKVPRWR